jgi:phosphoribosylanthranilate isomerase
MSVEVKICGLSTEKTVEAAVAGGARYVGFVFYPASPRAVTADQARILAGLVPPSVMKVGLFVDPDDALLHRTLDTLPLDILQLHGHEEPERCRAIRSQFKRQVMKAIRVGTAPDAAAAERYDGAVDRLLFDAHPPRRPNALPGGNGEVFDWTLLAGRHWPMPWMLSGGLNARVLAEAVRITGALTVDVSSGVETSPGVKDAILIREFLERARSVG